jgi:hypothetical protein
LFDLPDGTRHYMEVVVTDGVTVGHPCCVVPQCKNPLNSTWHHFCSLDPDHLHHETICAVEGCEEPVHQKMEVARLVQSGKGKVQRQKIAKLNDAMASTNVTVDVISDDLPVQDVKEWFKHNPSMGNIQLVQAHKDSTGVSDSELAPTSSTTLLTSDASSNPPPVLITNDNSCTGTKKDSLKLKALFCRQCTNNEQLFVRPCGVICGCATMYHHEAASNVLVVTFVSPS